MLLHNAQAMFIAPSEVQDQKLKRRLRGYSKSAVDRLLKDLAASYEHVWRERDQLQKRLDQLEKEIGPLREASGHLTETLAVAERAASALRLQAERDAEDLLEKAKERAKASQIALKGQHTRLKNEVERLRKLEQDLQAKLRSFLETGLELVDERKSTRETPILEEPTEPTPVAEERPTLHKTPA